MASRGRGPAARSSVSAVRRAAWRRGASPARAPGGVAREPRSAGCRRELLVGARPGGCDYSRRSPRQTPELAPMNLPHAASRASLSGITLAVAVAVAMSSSLASTSDASRNARSPTRWTTRALPITRPGRSGRRKLTWRSSVDWNWSGSECRQQRRTHRVEQHRRLEGPEHVAGRVGEVHGAHERELDRAVVHVGAEELQPERGSGARQ